MLAIKQGGELEGEMFSQALENGVCIEEGVALSLLDASISGNMKPDPKVGGWFSWNLRVAEPCKSFFFKMFTD